MRVVITFLLGFAIVYSLILYVESSQQADDPNEEIEMKIPVDLKEEDLTLDEKEKEEEAFEDIDGIHQWIGQSVDPLLHEYGEADRVDLTQYGYEWWIYKDIGLYIQFGVKDATIVSVFTNDENGETPLFQVGDSFEKVDNLLQFKNVVSLHGSFSSYQFELRDEEMEMRPLTSIGDVWVQIYFDVVDGVVSSVRYLDQETLLLHRPYSIVYRGALLEPEPISEEEWLIVQEGQAQQIFDLTNHIREKHQLSTLQWDDTTSTVAYHHSEDMYGGEYFSHTSPTYGELKDRLAAEYLSYQLAAENIAANYADAIEAVEGWLNSEGHRVNLLDERFTHLGVGVYRKYYTQNFITPW